MMNSSSSASCSENVIDKPNDCIAAIANTVATDVTEIGDGDNPTPPPKRKKVHTRSHNPKNHDVYQHFKRVGLDASGHNTVVTCVYCEAAYEEAKESYRKTPFGWPPMEAKKIRKRLEICHRHLATCSAFKKKQTGKRKAQIDAAQDENSAPPPAPGTNPFIPLSELTIPGLSNLSNEVDGESPPPHPKRKKVGTRSHDPKNHDVYQHFKRVGLDASGKNTVVICVYCEAAYDEAKEEYIKTPLGKAPSEAKKIRKRVDICQKHLKTCLAFKKAQARKRKAQSDAEQDEVSIPPTSPRSIPSRPLSELTAAAETNLTDEVVGETSTPSQARKKVVTRSHESGKHDVYRHFKRVGLDASGHNTLVSCIYCEAAYEEEKEAYRKSPFGKPPSEAKRIRKRFGNCQKHLKTCPAFKNAQESKPQAQGDAARDEASTPPTTSVTIPSRPLSELTIISVTNVRDEVDGETTTPPLEGKKVDRSLDSTNHDVYQHFQRVALDASGHNTVVTCIYCEAAYEAEKEAYRKAPFGKPPSEVKKIRKRIGNCQKHLKTCPAFKNEQTNKRKAPTDAGQHEAGTPPTPPRTIPSRPLSELTIASVTNLTDEVDGETTTTPPNGEKVGTRSHEPKNHHVYQHFRSVGRDASGHNTLVTCIYCKAACEAEKEAYRKAPFSRPPSEAKKIRKRIGNCQKHLKTCPAFIKAQASKRKAQPTLDKMKPAQLPLLLGRFLPGPFQN